MGQYFHAVVGNDKIRTAYNCIGGVKLLEHSWIGNYFTEYVASKIYKNPQRVAWVGDYAEASIAPCEESKKFWNITPDVKNKKTVYQSEDNRKSDFDITHKYLVNHTHKMYVDMEEYCENCYSKWGTVHPLPILTCMSNQCGSGDYYGPNSEYAGSWAWNVLEIKDEIPTDYIYFPIKFKDE